MSELQHEENDDLPIINPNVDQGNLFSDEKQLIERLKIEKKSESETVELDPTNGNVYTMIIHIYVKFSLTNNVSKHMRGTLVKRNRRLSGAHPEMTFPTLGWWSEKSCYN